MDDLVVTQDGSAGAGAGAGGSPSLSLPLSISTSCSANVTLFGAGLSAKCSCWNCFLPVLGGELPRG